MRSDEPEILDYPFASAALDPPAEWARLREECPVAHVRLPSGDTAKLVTRYEDVKEVLSHPDLSRDLSAPDAARISAGDEGAFSGVMVTALPQDGEAHLRWRRHLNQWFTAKRMNRMRPQITGMAETLVGDMVARGAPADLRASLGFPLPVWVICDMLGVPDSDRDRFARWSDMMLSLTRYSDEEMRTGMAEFLAYMAGHVADKRAEPGDDLLTELITGSYADGEPMNDDTLTATAISLLVAGHETTANMIGKMVAMLLVDGTRWQQVVDEPRLIRNAVEETLRADANSGFGMVRYLHQDTELAGRRLPKGTTVLCSMASANRDASVFDNAEDLDLARSPNPHLTFGAGPHSCLGQSLARTELQVSLEVLVRELPALELAVDPSELTTLDGLIVGGLRELPVRW